MIAQKIITILIVLALVLSVSSRPYANFRLAARQTNNTVIARQLTGARNNIGDIDLNSGTLVGGLTLEQATEICGGAQMNCCRETSGAGDSTNSGLINNVFGSGDLGILCNLIDIPLIGCMNQFYFFKFQQIRSC